MYPEQSSISIINKNNGQLTGESIGALPIKLITGISWLRFVFFGMAIALVIFLIIIFTAQKQVSVVQVTGKADAFKILQIN
jgi:hypothetical protein